MPTANQVWDMPRVMAQNAHKRAKQPSCLEAQPHAIMKLYVRARMRVTSDKRPACHSGGMVFRQCSALEGSSSIVAC